MKKQADGESRMSGSYSSLQLTLAAVLSVRC